MSPISQTTNGMQAVWVVDSDRWYSNLRWQCAVNLPSARYQRFLPAAIIESPSRLIEFGNQSNLPLVVVFELDQASLPTLCELMPRFAMELPNALLMAVGVPELESWTMLMRLSGIVDFCSQESDLKRLWRRIGLFQSSILASRARVVGEEQEDKSLTGLVNQIRHQLRFNFD